MAVFRVVLDACVLYPIGLTDLLLTSSLSGLYQAYWSPTIIDEALRNLIADRPDVPEHALRRRFAMMDEAIESASVEAPATLIEAMTNDPKDRHVLALAVWVGAEVIVTDNLKDFPADACAPYGVEIQSPDTFVEHLVSLDPATMWDTLDEMASRRRSPPATALDVLEHFAGGHLPIAMTALRAAASAQGLL